MRWIWHGFFSKNFRSWKFHCSRKINCKSFLETFHLDVWKVKQTKSHLLGDTWFSDVTVDILLSSVGNISVFFRFSKKDSPSWCSTDLRNFGGCMMMNTTFPVWKVINFKVWSHGWSWCISIKNYLLLN